MPLTRPTNLCAFACCPSLKNLGPSKILVQFLFAYEVLLEKSCLHLVCYAAVSLLLSWVLFRVYYRAYFVLMCR